MQTGTTQTRQASQTPITVEGLTRQAEDSIQFAGESIADMHGMSSVDFTAFASAKVMSQIPQNGATYPTNGFACAPHYGALTALVALEIIAQQQLDANAVTVLSSAKSQTDKDIITLMPAVTVTRFENQSPSFILAQIATDGGKPLGLSQIASLRVTTPASRLVARFDEIVHSGPVLVLGVTHRDHPNLFLLIEDDGKEVRWISSEEILNECTVFHFGNTGTGVSEEG